MPPNGHFLFSMGTYAQITGNSKALHLLDNFHLLDFTQFTDLPYALSFRIGSSDGHVFLGVGDIVIGVFISKFALNFKGGHIGHVVCVGVAFSTAIGLLSLVRW